MKKSASTATKPDPGAGFRPADPGARRAYMGKEDRRNMLLQKAAELVIAGDWKSLKMSALALHGQVSRQLVYQHFPNLESLLIETAAFLFSDLWQQTKSVIDNPANDLEKTIRKAATLTLDLEPGCGDALWQILSGISRESQEMMKFYQQMRGVVIDLWMPRVPADLKLKKQAARAFIWSQILAFWGLRQMIRDGVISRKQATELFDQHIRQAIPIQIKAANPGE